MKKWNEISYSMFKDIFLKIVRKEDWTKDKVFEIQDPISIMLGKRDDRFYLSTCIDPEPFHKKWPQEHIEMLKTLWGNKFNMFMEKDGLITIFLLRDRKPYVVPMIFGEEQYDNFLRSHFGDSFGPEPVARTEKEQIKWYLLREDGSRFLDIRPGANLEYTDEDKKIRVRSIEKDEWMSMMEHFLSGHELEGKENDLLTFIPTEEKVEL